MAITLFFESGMAVVNLLIDQLDPGVVPTISKYKAELERLRPVHAWDSGRQLAREKPAVAEAFEAATKKLTEFSNRRLAMNNVTSGELVTSPEAEPQRVQVLAATGEHADEFHPLVAADGKPVEINIAPGAIHMLPREVFQAAFVKFIAAKPFSARLVLRGKEHKGSSAIAADIRHALPATAAERAKFPPLFVSSQGVLHVPAGAKEQPLDVYECVSSRPTQPPPGAMDPKKPVPLADCIAAGDCHQLLDVAGDPVRVLVKPGCACILPDVLRGRTFRLRSAEGGDFVATFVSC